MERFTLYNFTDEDLLRYIYPDRILLGKKLQKPSLKVKYVLGSLYRRFLCLLSILFQNGEISRVDYPYLTHTLSPSNIQKIKKIKQKSVELIRTTKLLKIVILALNYVKISRIYTTKKRVKTRKRNRDTMFYSGLPLNQGYVQQKIPLYLAPLTSLLHPVVKKKEIIYILSSYSWAETQTTNKIHAQIIKALRYCGGVATNDPRQGGASQTPLLSYQWRV